MQIRKTIDEAMKSVEAAKKHLQTKLRNLPKIAMFASNATVNLFGVFQNFFYVLVTFFNCQNAELFGFLLKLKNGDHYRKNIFLFLF